jgi:hypothetical protein
MADSVGKIIAPTVAVERGAERPAERRKKGTPPPGPAEEKEGAEPKGEEGVEKEKGKLIDIRI